MKVKDLISQLQTVDQNIEVFINSDEVTGITTINGSIKEGYFGKAFRSFVGSKKKVLMFTHLTEISTGEVEPTIYWNA